MLPALWVPVLHVRLKNAYELGSIFWPPCTITIRNPDLKYNTMWWNNMQIQPATISYQLPNDIKSKHILCWITSTKVTPKLQTAPMDMLSQWSGSNSQCRTFNLKPRNKKLNYNTDKYCNKYYEKQKEAMTGSCFTTLKKLIYWV